MNFQFKGISCAVTFFVNLFSRQAGHPYDLLMIITLSASACLPFGQSKVRILCDPVIRQDEPHEPECVLHSQYLSGLFNRLTLATISFAGPGVGHTERAERHVKREPIAGPERTAPTDRWSFPVQSDPAVIPQQRGSNPVRAESA